MPQTLADLLATYQSAPAQVAEKQTASDASDKAVADALAAQKAAHDALTAANAVQPNALSSILAVMPPNKVFSAGNGLVAVLIAGQLLIGPPDDPASVTVPDPTAPPAGA